MSSRQRIVGLAVLIAGVVAQRGMALDPDRSLPRFQRRVWTAEQGLPHDGVMAVAETTDGYLWFATLKGLARFDGVNFTVFDQNTAGLSPEPVGDLAAGPHGDLWIAHAVLSHYENGKLTTWGAKEGLTDGLREIKLAPDGTIWGAGRQRLIHFDGKRFQSWGREAGLPEGDLAGFALDRAGLIWIATVSSGVFAFDGRHFTHFTTMNGLTTNSVSSIHADEEGGVWISGTGGEHVVHHTADGRMESSSLPGAPIFSDRSGGTWMLSNNALFRASHGQISSLPLGNGLSDVASIFEDGEGNIWISTTYTGAWELIDSAFTNYAMPDGLTANVVTAVTQDTHGTIWAGTADGNVAFRGSDDRFHTIGTNGMCHNVTALTADTDGTLWIGCDTGVVAVRGGRLTQVWKDAVTPLGMVARDGELWVATFEKGITVIAHDRVVRQLTSADGLGAMFVRSVHKLADGSMIAGTGQGAHLIRGGSISAKLPLNGVIAAATQDGDGTVWMAIEGHGIARMRKGTFVELETAAGIVNTALLGIVDDGAGSLWLPTMNGGLFRYSKREFDAVASGQATRMHARAFGTEDGLGSRYATFGNPAAFRAADGSLWFTTSRGLSTVRPEKIRPVGRPRVLIESLMADGVVVPAGATPRLSSRIQRVAIHFTSPAITDGERTTFEYRLDAFENKWNDSGVRRVIEYTNLPPGRYAFRVVARNHDGLRSDPAVFAFEIAPALSQTLWFRLLVAFVLIASIAAAHLTRMRFVRKREERFRAVLDTRTIELQSANKELEASNLRLLQSTSIDEVTGLANRRWFDQRLAAALHESVHASTPLSIAIAVVENFDEVRTRHGRRRADVRLRQIADVLRQGVSVNASVARYESNEFAMLFADMDGEEATAIARKLEFAVAALQIPLVSIRAGVTTAEREDNPETLIARADAGRLATSI
jgi:diguanylate cyclase (GGDEF)-like protein